MSTTKSRGASGDEIEVGDISQSDAVAIGRNATAVKATGNFTIDKRTVRTSGGDYFEHIERYIERRRPPAPHQSPALPSYFQPRLDVMDAVGATMATTPHPVIAITGFEGVGKTTLASAIATTFADRFPEATLWGAFKGQTGELRDVLGSFLTALDIDTEQFKNLDARINALRSALADRQALIVLDDLSDQGFDPLALLPAGVGHAYW